MCRQMEILTSADFTVSGVSLLATTIEATVCVVTDSSLTVTVVSVVSTFVNIYEKLRNS